MTIAWRFQGGSIMPIEHEPATVFGNAIYAAYLTGRAGSTFALLRFHDGVITGLDAGEGCYDGDYELGPDKQNIVGTIKVNLPAGALTITGVTSSERPLQFDVPFALPLDLDPDAVYRMETPTGPVNAKFVRRGL